MEPVEAVVTPPKKFLGGDPVDTLYVGIDIGKRKHEASFLDGNGHQYGKSIVFDNSSQGVEKLLHRAKSSKTTKIIFGLEATGHYWLPLYAHLTANGYSVKVINPIQSDSLRNLYIRVTKTDRKDSFLIAEVLRFGRFTETKIASESLLQLRELSRMRVEFTESVGDIKRRIIGILDRIFPEFTSCFGKTFGNAAIKVLKAYPSPKALAESNFDDLVRLLKEHSQNRFAEEKARQLKDVAQNSFGANYGMDAFTLELKLLLEQLDFITNQVKQLDQSINALMKEHHLILSIPGIGATLGATILGEIGDINRFENAKKLRAYAGLDATVYQSGGFKGSRSRLSKRGSPYLRRALWIAAGVARLHDPTLKSFYDRLINKGKHPKQAQAAVASKLCTIIYAVLSKNQPYDPNYQEINTYQ